MLSLEDINHQYDSAFSVKNINIDVPEGKVVSLLGPSGCGKSTILRLVAGLEKPQSGSIRINGECVASDRHFTPPEARGVGFVFQDYALFPHMTVAQNIAYSLDGATHLSLSSGAKSKRIQETLKQVYLTDCASAYPYMLSGGQQQRVALARAIAPEPKLILLDEPYAGLDSRLREEIRDDVLHMLKRVGATVLLVTHDSEEAMFMSDSIYVMKNGDIQQSGDPEDLYLRPQNAFVAEFFGEVNRIDGSVKDGKIDSPFGRFKVKDKVSQASLIIRNEAFSIGNKKTPNAEVVATRMMGNDNLIHLSVPFGKKLLHLHARTSGKRPPRIGDKVTLSVDRSQVFVFPT